MKHIVVGHHYAWGDYCCVKFGDMRTKMFRIIDGLHGVYIEMNSGGIVARINHCPFCGADITIETKGDHETKGKRK
jgi:hypothetical protein